MLTEQYPSSHINIYKVWIRQKKFHYTKILAAILLAIMRCCPKSRQWSAVLSLKISERSVTELLHHIPNANQETRKLALSPIQERNHGYHGTSNSSENFLRKMKKRLPVQRLSIVVTLTKSASHRRYHPTFQNRSLTGSKIHLALCSSRQSASADSITPKFTRTPTSTAACFPR